MKSITKTLAFVVAISAITVGAAFAMVPIADLKNTMHPDRGRASTEICDLDDDVKNLRDRFMNRDVTNQDLEERPVF